MDQEAHLLQTWHQNAGAWTEAIAEGQIASRLLVTNAAIVNTVLQLSPRSVADLGCGEGWLCRELTSSGMACLGTDAIPELVKNATAAGGNFFAASYQDIVNGNFVFPSKVDVAVFNFSLFGKDLVGQLLVTIKKLLNPGGHLVIQTLHPLTNLSGQPYADGWRTGSWQGFSEYFTNPAPWYYRTMGSWVELLRSTGFDIIECKEPLHPDTGQPASLIWVASESRGK